MKTFNNLIQELYQDKGVGKGNKWHLVNMTTRKIVSIGNKVIHNAPTGEYDNDGFPILSYKQATVKEIHPPEEHSPNGYGHLTTELGTHHVREYGLKFVKV